MKICLNIYSSVTHRARVDFMYQAQWYVRDLCLKIWGSHAPQGRYGGRKIFSLPPPKNPFVRFPQFFYRLMPSVSPSHDDNFETVRAIVFEKSAEIYAIRMQEYLVELKHPPPSISEL